MTTESVIVRKAEERDIPFLAETIIQAEKSGTDRLSYSTILGLTEKDTNKYLQEILLEESYGCELSLDSFFVAEKSGVVAGAISAWIEGIDDVSSSVLKGNLLNYTLPIECIKKAISVSNIINEINIDHIWKTAQLGLVYVAGDFRGQNIVGILLDSAIKSLKESDSTLSEMYVQVFSNNIPAIKAYTKAGFSILQEKTSTSGRVEEFLPSNTKILMKKNI